MSNSIIPDQVGYFVKTREEEIREFQTLAIFYQHQPTRAPVLILHNQDDHKVFCSYFRTIPKDNTGLPHILEHSVLNGSRRYPVKEPFLELLKASLYTFLNAMTYDDKTVYPVASRNPHDFRNLMDVYLDAIYHPLLTKYTFMQEGWHFTIDQSSQQLGYSGVVYNEMLGATSTPESILYYELQKQILWGTPYQFNSGGDPESIPQLTYEMFIDFYRSCYHPSNSRTIIYGDIHIPSILEHLSQYYDEYTFRESTLPSNLRVNRLTNPQEVVHFYPATEKDIQSQSCYTVLAWLLPEPHTGLDFLSYTILEELLIGHHASPLYRALNESGLGESPIVSLEDEIVTPYFISGLKGVPENRLNNFPSLVQNTLINLVENRIPSKTLESAINTVEFRLREANFGSYSKGLVFALSSAVAWLYDKDPLIVLRFEEPLSLLKTRIHEEPYFENIIQQHFLDNSHRVRLSLLPDPQYETKRRQRLKETLQSIQNQMSPEERERIIRENEELRLEQERPNSPEALATIPKLPLSAINRQQEIFPIEKIQDDPPLYFTPEQTNGIGYLIIDFNLDSLPRGFYPWLPFYSALLLKLGTPQMDYVELAEEIHIHTGGIALYPSYKHYWQNPDQGTLRFQIAGKAVTGKIPKLMELIHQIIILPNFVAPDRIRETILNQRSSMETSLKSSGHRYALSRIEAYDSESGRIQESLSGLNQYFFLRWLEKTFQENPEYIYKTLQMMHFSIINQQLLSIHLTGSSAELNQIQNSLQVFRDLPCSTILPQDRPLPFSWEVSPKEGILCPTKVNFVAAGFNFLRHGCPCHGSGLVLSRLLSSEYLWNQVRVLGNAYGAGCNYHLSSGMFTCNSYRDPHIEKTLETFFKIYEFIRDLDLSSNELEKLIISTIGKIDTPKSPDDKGNIAFSRMITRTPNEDLQRIREEVLDTQWENLKVRFLEILKIFAQRANYCVVTSTENVQSCKYLFSSIITPFSEKEPKNNDLIE